MSDPDVVDRDLVDEEDGEEDEPSFFADPKRLAQTGIVVLLLVGAIYVLLPEDRRHPGGGREARRR